jgi:uncharacterized membrane protein YfcA
MRIVMYLAMGGAIGVLSGAMGIGGGVLLVPLLMWLAGFTFGLAAGTSLAVLAMPVALLGAWRAYRDGRVDLEAAVCIALAFAAGAYFGADLVNRIPKATLHLLFGLLMIVIGFRFVLATSSEAANAAAGLFAAALAWLAFLGLRALGRRHLARPDLGRHIREEATHGRGEGDYQI